MPEPAGHGTPLLFARSLFLPEDLGGNRYPYEVIRRLGQRGHPVTVVTPRLHGRFPRLPGVRYRHYPVNRAHPLATHLTNVLGSARALRREVPAPYTVALAGSYDVALALLWAGVVPRLPLIFLFHSEFYSEWVQALGRGPRGLVRRTIRSYMAAVERQVFAGSARIVAVSAFSARQIAERAPRARERTRVIPTGVDTGYFAPAPDLDRVAARRAAGQPADRPLVVGVGRLVPVKQFDRLITAFAAVRAGGLVARLVIAGAGPDEARLRRLIATFGMQQDVELAGYCDPPRLRALLQAADLQVCSSAFENLSLAILEGMACGTPVLGTPGGGTPELVGRIDPALVLPGDDAGALADGLARCLRDPAALRRRGALARAVAVAAFDWERVVDSLEELCTELSVTMSG